MNSDPLPSTLRNNLLPRCACRQCDATISEAERAQGDGRCALCRQGCDPRNRMPQGTDGHGYDPGKVIDMNNLAIGLTPFLPDSIKPL